MGHSLTLILGGARSGKSDYAQALVERGEGRVLFVATAAALDGEMRARIAGHRTSRPSHWQTLEAPMDVGQAIQATAPREWILLDCMTLLASNILLSLPEPVLETDFYAALDREVDSLLETFNESQSNWVIVSNEAGLGIVPAYPLGRFFRDGLGRANQRLARVADTVLFMVAGIPMVVKGEA